MVTAATDQVRFDVHDGAATIQLNRAEKRNAVSRDMWIAMTVQLRAAADDPKVRALVVSGLPGVFCAGADLASVKHAEAAVAAEYQQIALAAFAALRDFPRPTLAAIDGLCIGGGCNIALACDVRIAGPQASFAIPAVRHGIVYDERTIRRWSNWSDRVGRHTSCSPRSGSAWNGPRPSGWSTCRSTTWRRPPRPISLT